MRRLDRSRLQRIEAAVRTIEARRRPDFSPAHHRMFWAAIASVPGWHPDAEQLAAAAAPIRWDWGCR